MRTKIRMKEQEILDEVEEDSLPVEGDEEILNNNLDKTEDLNSSNDLDKDLGEYVGDDLGNELDNSSDKDLDKDLGDGLGNGLGEGLGDELGGGVTRESTLENLSKTLVLLNYFIEQLGDTATKEPMLIEAYNSLNSRFKTSLKEDSIIIPSNQESVPMAQYDNEEPTEEEVDFGISAMLMSAIQNTWLTIEDFNSMIATITNEEVNREDVLEIINDLSTKELEKVAKLEKALTLVSPNVEEFVAENEFPIDESLDKLNTVKDPFQMTEFDLVRVVEISLGVSWNKAMICDNIWDRLELYLGAKNVDASYNSGIIKVNGKKIFKIDYSNEGRHQIVLNKLYTYNCPNLKSEYSYGELLDGVDFLYYLDVYDLDYALKYKPNWLELPKELMNEELLTEKGKNSIGLGSEITQDQAKTFYNRGYIDLVIYNDEGKQIKIPAWHSKESQKEVSKELKNGKEIVKGNKVEIDDFETVIANAKKELGNDIKFTTSSPETNKGYTNQEFEDDGTITKTGKAYKLFLLKNGKLYPPMIKNPGLVDTPIGKWVKCGALEFTEVSASWGKPKAKDSELAFRPGWHLGEAPYAPQFESRKNPGYFSSDKFVWAECEYNAEVDYQDRAKSYGYTKDGNFTHSAMGLPYRPENGYYKMRTNPNPDTIAWVISGEMKVSRILGDDEVEKICNDMGVPFLKRPGGNKTIKELGLNESLKK